MPDRILHTRHSHTLTHLPRLQLIAYLPGVLSVRTSPRWTLRRRLASRAGWAPKPRLPRLPATARPHSAFWGSR
jgi:hypothetical protein